MIKAVSQLISEHVGIGSTRFQSSLSIINTFANSDKGMKVIVQFIVKSTIIKTLYFFLAMKTNK